MLHFESKQRTLSTTVALKRNEAEEQQLLKINWLDHYKPLTITDFKAHYSKANALKQWFEQVRAGSCVSADQANIMIVFGGSGSGKRTFCQLLANDLNITLHDTDVTADVSTFGFGMPSDENRSLYYNSDRDFISGHIFGNSYDNEIGSKGSFGNILYSTYTTRSMLADEMSLRAQYPAVISTQRINCTRSTNKTDETISVAVVMESESTLLSNDKATQTLRQQLLQSLLSRNMPILLLLSGSFTRDDAFYVNHTLLSGPLQSFRQSCNIKTMFWPAPTEIKLKKLLTAIRDKEILTKRNIHFCKQRNASNSFFFENYRQVFNDVCLKEIVARSQGDIRQAILLLQFLYISTPIEKSSMVEENGDTIILLSDDDDDDDDGNNHDMSGSKIRFPSKKNDFIYPNKRQKLNKIEPHCYNNNDIQCIPEIVRDVLCSAQQCYYNLLHAKLDDYGCLPMDNNDLCERSGVRSEMLSNVLFLNYKWSIENHLCLAHTGYNSLAIENSSERQDSSQHQEPPIPAKRFFIVPPDPLEACVAVLDSLSDCDLWQTRRFDPAALLDRSTSTYSSQTLTFGDTEQLLFPEGYCVAIMSRCVAVSKGVSCDSYIKQSKNAFGSSTNNQFHPIYTKSQYSFHTLRKSKLTKMSEIRIFVEDTLSTTVESLRVSANQNKVFTPSNSDDDSHIRDHFSEKEQYSTPCPAVMSSVSQWAIDVLPFYHGHNLSVKPKQEQSLMQPISLHSERLHNAVMKSTKDDTFDSIVDEIESL